MAFFKVLPRVALFMHDTQHTNLPNANLLVPMNYSVSYDAATLIG
jgi:hypothetical protein